MRGTLSILLGVALVTTSCKTYSSRQISDPGPAAERLRAGGSLQHEVDLLAQPLIDKGEAYGLAVGITSPTGVHVYGYGETGREDGPRVPGGDTIFEVGSLSKVFVTVVLAQLVAEGRLRYEDTVRDILPSGVRLSRDVGELTVYELATHTSGLPRQPGTFSQLVYFFRYLFTGRNLYGYIDKEFLYRYLGRCHPKPRAERSYVYSNLGAGLLAHLIEVRSGKTVPQLVRERITRPLGMSDTVYSLNDEQKRRLAIGHAGGQPRFVPRQTPLEPWEMGEIMHPTAGLYSTANDLLIFANANLGILQDPLNGLLRWTQQAQLHLPEEDVALGWLINYLDDCTITYKHGMVAGYCAYLGMDVDRRHGVVVLCNTFGWNDKVGHSLLLRLAAARNPAPEPHPPGSSIASRAPSILAPSVR